MPSLSGTLALREDVLLVPVTELSEESRVQIGCEAGDFAVSRAQSRNGSKIIDAEAADLLSYFRKPRTVAEVVILFGREKGLDPNEVLEGAFPMLRSMAEGGFLVAAGRPAEDAGAAGATHWSAGANLLGGSVLRTLQVLDDTEVYLLSRSDGRLSVLKVERFSSQSLTDGSVRARLRHEAAFLARIGGQLAPELRGQGELDGRLYLELEFVPGVDAATAAEEWRERGSEEARRGFLALALAITRAYAALHGRGVLHGDVHPRNILVGRDSKLRLIDFGVAHSTNPDGGLPMPPQRGGIPFFFEPELARASLAGLPPPSVSAEGEQHAVAALIYFLTTGAHWQDFRLGRETMLQDIAERKPLSFLDRGAAPWPALEAVLDRALAKEPAQRFPSMSAFDAALAEVETQGPAPRTPASTLPLTRLIDHALGQATSDGLWGRHGLTPAPTCSLNYGSGGLALGLLHIAHRRGDARTLALADGWAWRAMSDMGEEGAFYNAEIEITPELVGRCSPYHSPSGVHAVAALIARAIADPMAQSDALAGFLEAARRPAAGLDLTLGRTSTLLGAAILLDAVPAGGLVDSAPLRQFGDASLAGLWRDLDAKPAIAEADISYPGIAHGWAGFLYATLQWCRVSHAAIPTGMERRLVELEALALPAGRGLDWPWMLHRAGEPLTMAGWCNGSCGFVFLWTLANRLLGESRYLDLALGAAWRSWDAPELTTSLCCGLAGRAYALLNIYRATGEKVWLDRARDLGVRAATKGQTSSEYPHSLYKGGFGLAVLAADLEQPEDARMPFFEPIGYLD